MPSMPMISFILFYLREVSSDNIVGNSNINVGNSNSKVGNSNIQVGKINFKVGKINFKARNSTTLVGKSYFTVENFRIRVG